MSQETVLQEFRKRRDRERAKVKYGAAGQDVFACAVNALIGLPDAAATLEAQLRSYDLPPTLLDEAVAVCRQLAASGSRHALDIIDVRQRLLKRGIALGKPETA